MAEIFFRAASKEGEIPSLFMKRAFFGMMAACLFMTTGYALSGAALYGSLSLGLASVPGLLIKSAVNIAAVYLAGGTLEKARGEK